MSKWMPMLCALALAWTASAGAAEWTMDPAGSQLQYIVTYQRQEAPGVFRRFDTKLRFDPQQSGAGGELRVQVDITSADMDSAEINEGMSVPEWFDFARFPKAEFHATDIRRADGGRYVARGTLTLKGVRREVAVPFNWNSDADRAAMEGELTLNRSMFGIGTGEWATGNLIGLDVKLKFKVKLRRSR